MQPQAMSMNNLNFYPVQTELQASPHNFDDPPKTQFA